jgi:hypothetical protein
MAGCNLNGGSLYKLLLLLVGGAELGESVLAIGIDFSAFGVAIKA